MSEMKSNDFPEDDEEIKMLLGAARGAAWVCPVRDRNTCCAHH